MLAQREDLEFLVITSAKQRGKKKKKRGGGGGKDRKTFPLIYQMGFSSVPGKLLFNSFIHFLEYSPANMDFYFFSHSL